MNRYPLWKYLIVAAVLALGALYALPNAFAPDPALQIALDGDAEDGSSLRRQVSQALDDAGIAHFGMQVDGRLLTVRLRQQEQQLPARELLQRALGEDLIVAMAQAPTTPDWLRRIGGQSMKLGLDLSGGAHFLLRVDTEAYLQTRAANYLSDIKRALRKERIRSRISLAPDKTSMLLFANDIEERTQATALLREEFADLQRDLLTEGGKPAVRLSFAEQAVRDFERYAVEQNLVTLRNRVNELGVSEPIVQRQGKDRIVLQLPGVQDTAQAKRILGRTANVEFRLAPTADTPLIDREKLPFLRSTDRRLVGDEGGWVLREVIATGDNIINAQAGFDPNTNAPAVNITLDSEGGQRMHRATRYNLNRHLGSVFIERKTRYRTVVDEGGKVTQQREKYTQRSLINYGVIKGVFGSRFRINNMESSAAASELALLLRAGALPAPLEFVEERTVGPSLGAENIERGLRSVQLGMLLVLVFMVLYYGWFGLAANLALATNLLLLTACMSLLSATLTLPGIAGIVLTVGMAVDANVLIFSRIREEWRSGKEPQQAIRQRLPARAGHDHGRQHHHLDRRRDPVLHRHRPRARLCGHLVHRHHDVDVHLHHGARAPWSTCAAPRAPTCASCTSGRCGAAAPRWRRDDRRAPPAPARPAVPDAAERVPG